MVERHKLGMYLGAYLMDKLARSGITRTQLDESGLGDMLLKAGFGRHLAETGMEDANHTAAGLAAGNPQCSNSSTPPPPSPPGVSVSFFVVMVVGFW